MIQQEFLTSFLNYHSIINLFELRFLEILSKVKEHNFKYLDLCHLRSVM